MVFSEPLFLFFFLPAVFLLSRLIRGTRAQNWLLLAASLVFYFVGEPKFLWLLLASAGANYLFGLWLEKTDGKKAVLVFAVLGVWSMAPDRAWGGRPGPRFPHAEHGPFALLARVLPPLLEFLAESSRHS